MWVISLRINDKDYLGVDVLEDTGSHTYNHFNYINKAMMWLPLYWFGFYIFYMIAFKYCLKNPYDYVI